MDTITMSDNNPKIEITYNDAGRKHAISTIVDGVLHTLPFSLDNLHKLDLIISDHVNARTVIHIATGICIAFGKGSASLTVSVRAKLGDECNGGFARYKSYSVYKYSLEGAIALAVNDYYRQPSRPKREKLNKITPKMVNQRGRRVAKRYGMTYNDL